MNVLQYAIKDNKLVHIDLVEGGLGCNCVCPSCGSILIAKKGTIKIHHFAHYDSEECENCYETSLHLLAKEILQEERNIKLPAVYLDFSPGSYKQSEQIYGEKYIRFNCVYLERRIDDMIPDLILEANGSELIVEIFVTHNIDETKLQKIQKQGLSALLIDLSKIDYSTTKQELKELIIHDVKNKKWLYNKKEREIYERFKEKALPFKITNNGKGNFCPQYKYGWKGVSSARTEDCIGCEYCFSIYGNANCLGYNGVSKVKDLDNPKLAEIAIIKMAENKIKPEWLEATQCKVCKKGYMKIIEGKNGTFLGCSNHPNCKNTIKI